MNAQAERRHLALMDPERLLAAEVLKKAAEDLYRLAWEKRRWRSKPASRAHRAYIESELSICRWVLTSDNTWTALLGDAFDQDAFADQVSRIERLEHNPLEDQRVNFRLNYRIREKE
jgi:hypothetical protein